LTQNWVKTTQHVLSEPTNIPPLNHSKKKCWIVSTQIWVKNGQTQIWGWKFKILTQLSLSTAFFWVYITLYTVVYCILTQTLKKKINEFCTLIWVNYTKHKLLLSTILIVAFLSCDILWQIYCYTPNKNPSWIIWVVSCRARSGEGFPASVLHFDTRCFSPFQSSCLSYEDFNWIRIYCLSLVLLHPTLSENNPRFVFKRINVFLIYPKRYATTYEDCRGKCGKVVLLSVIRHPIV